VRRDPTFDTPALAPDALRGRTVVITGASDGIGRALAERCALAAARVVLVGRNEAKTRHAVSDIRSRTGSDTVSYEIADLLYLDEQQALAERLRAAHPVLHALVNNAGALFLEREVTRDGLERTFALNHMAYVQLGLRLLPALLAAAGPQAPARLVNVASRAHAGARLDLADLQHAHRWSGWRAYGASKLANILFTRALAARVDARCVCVHAVHPGLVASRFAVNNGRAGRVQRRVMDWFSVSNLAGSDTIAWLLASPAGAASSGGYWDRRRRVDPSRTARDTALADALWTRSLAIAGLTEPVAGCHRS
jgi:NAD(P)-dependent dehydrogenase (short-subunit alcohol dehydrogenase family)